MDLVDGEQRQYLQNADEDTDRNIGRLQTDDPCQFSSSSWNPQWDSDTRIRNRIMMEFNCLVSLLGAIRLHGNLSSHKHDMSGIKSCKRTKQLWITQYMNKSPSQWPYPRNSMGHKIWPKFCSVIVLHCLIFIQNNLVF